MNYQKYTLLNIENRKYLPQYWLDKAEFKEFEPHGLILSRGSNLVC